ncbi:MAG: type II toxin-antitoxin system RelE/ParE family toxin [Nitrospinae bacterium]|nr:type II toxin-antitoxin system RelE/ParE family toxin [Nitrospinota bacterium]
MLKSFADKETRRLFERDRSKIPPNIQRKATELLLLLNSAISLADISTMPGNRLEKLTGDRRGFYSIRINDQWRICFRWEGVDAHDVEITDYH